MEIWNFDPYALMQRNVDRLRAMGVNPGTMGARCYGNDYTPITTIAHVEQVDLQDVRNVLELYHATGGTWVYYAPF